MDSSSMWLGRAPGGRVPPVALHHQHVGLAGQLAQPVAGRGVARVGDDLPAPGRTGSRSSAGRARGRPRRPGSAGARPPATIPSTSTKRRSRLARAMLGDRAHRTRLVHARPGGPRFPGGPTTCSVRPPPTSAAACSRKGQPKQWSAWKCETTTTSIGVDGEPAAAQVGQRGGRRLDQHRVVHDEAVPVAARRGQEVARPEEGETRSRRVGQREQRRHQHRVTLHGGVGDRQAPVQHQHQVGGGCPHALRERPGPTQSAPVPATRQLDPVSVAVRVTAPGSASRSDPTMISMNSGTPSSARAGSQRPAARADPLGVPAVHRRLLGLVPAHRARVCGSGHHAQHGASGPASRSAPTQRVGAPAQPRQPGRCRRAAAVSSPPERSSAFLARTFCTPVPLHLADDGGPGRAPTTSGTTARGSSRSRNSHRVRQAAALGRDGLELRRSKPKPALAPALARRSSRRLDQQFAAQVRRQALGQHAPSRRPGARSPPARPRCAARPAPSRSPCARAGAGHPPAGRKRTLARRAW